MACTHMFRNILQTPVSCVREVEAAEKLGSGDLSLFGHATSGRPRGPLAGGPQCCSKLVAVEHEWQP